METKEGTSLRGNLNHDCARLVVAVADVDLAFDGIRFDAVDGGGTNPGTHTATKETPANGKISCSNCPPENTADKSCLNSSLEKPRLGLSN